MKKIIVMLLVLIMVFSLVACENKSEEEKLNINTVIKTENDESEVIEVEQGPAFADVSIEEVIVACQTNTVPDNWKVGDSKTIMVGENKVYITIIGKNHDIYADNSGVAPLTFMTEQAVDENCMNFLNNSDNKGGWVESEMYDYLNNEVDGIITTLAPEVQAAIKPVLKNTNKGSFDSDETPATEIVTSHDKLFLLSLKEVFGDNINLGDHSAEVFNNEGAQYAYFENGGAPYLFGMNPEIEDEYWLRTPTARLCFTHGFFFVQTREDYDGNIDFKIGSSSAKFWRGIAFAFCF